MSRGHAFHHYATKADYEPVIADVAAQIAVKYVDKESRVDPNFPVYLTPLDAPQFGICRWPQSPDMMFLVFPEDAELPWEYWPHRQSLDPAIPPRKYLFSIGDINYRYIDFHPSGFHKSGQWGEGLLQGWLATNSEHPDSLAIFNAFKKSIKKHFEYFRYSGVYVGPEAVKYFEAGGRLAPDLRRPREGDAKRAPPVTNTTP